MITDNASATKTPPMIAYTISNLRSTAMQAKAAPNEREPTSPINISAGYELYQRKPSPDPTMPLAKIATSETSGKYGINR